MVPAPWEKPLRTALVPIVCVIAGAGSGCGMGMSAATTGLATSVSAAAEDLRTSYDKPDFSGVWDFRTLTPLERPEKFADSAVLTTEQAAEIEDEAVQATATNDRASDPNRCAPPL